MSDVAKAPDPFPQRLRAARIKREMSQGDLAAKAGLPPASISHFESGARKPSFANLRRLAQVLNASTDYLLGRVDDLGLGIAADPLYRDVENLTDGDRELAKDFIGLLAARSSRKTGDVD